MKECKKCGHPLGDNAKFCPNCGNPVDEPSKEKSISAKLEELGSQIEKQELAQKNISGEEDFKQQQKEEPAAVKPVSNNPDKEVTGDTENVSVPYDVYLDTRKSYKPLYIIAGVLALLIIGGFWWLSSRQKDVAEKENVENVAPLDSLPMGNGFYSYEGKWNTGTDIVECRVEFEKIGDTLVNCVFTNISTKENSKLIYHKSNGQYVFKDKDSDGKKIVLQMKEPENASSSLEGVGLLFSYDDKEKALTLNRTSRTKEDVENEMKAQEDAKQQAAVQAARQQAAAQAAAQQQAAAAQAAARKPNVQRPVSTPRPQANPAPQTSTSTLARPQINSPSSGGNRHRTNPNGFDDTTR